MGGKETGRCDSLYPPPTGHQVAEARGRAVDGGTKTQPSRVEDKVERQGTPETELLSSTLDHHYLAKVGENTQEVIETMGGSPSLSQLFIRLLDLTSLVDGSLLRRAIDGM